MAEGNGGSKNVQRSKLEWWEAMIIGFGVIATLVGIAAAVIASLPMIASVGVMIAEGILALGALIVEMKMLFTMLLLF